MQKLFLYFFLFIVIISCNSETTTMGDNDGLSAFSADSLGKHIELYHLMISQGRKPFTEGETKTINYLKNNLLRRP